MSHAKINWPAERERYAMGDESFAELAARIGVSETAVERQSRLGESWAELRRDFRENGAAEAAQRGTESYATKLSRVRDKATDVAELALSKLEERLVTDKMANRDLIGAVKLAMAIRFEVSGSDGRPIAVQSLQEELDQLSVEDLERLARQTP